MLHRFSHLNEEAAIGGTDCINAPRAGVGETFLTKVSISNRASEGIDAIAARSIRH